MLRLLTFPGSLNQSESYQTVNRGAERVSARPPVTGGDSSDMRFEALVDVGYEVALRSTAGRLSRFITRPLLAGKVGPYENRCLDS